jgi:hypothetical protein
VDYMGKFAATKAAGSASAASSPATLGGAQ